MAAEIRLVKSTFLKSLAQTLIKLTPRDFLILSHLVLLNVILKKNVFNSRRGYLCLCHGLSEYSILIGWQVLIKLV